MADCLLALLFPGCFGRRLFILFCAGMFLTMRVSFVRAWGLRFPFLLVFLSSVLSLRPWRSCRRRASEAVMSWVPVPRPHHLIIISCGGAVSFSSSSGAASSSPVFFLLIVGGYRAADGGRCLSSALVSFSLS